MLIRAWNELLLAYTLPTVGANLVYMHVWENVGFITPTIDVELIEVSHKGVIRTWRWCILWIQVYPFILDGLEFCQIIEICSTFSRIPSEEENAVLKW